MRRAARTDANHSEIRQTFRNLGCTVADTSRLGDGFPDLVVQWGQATMLIEVKSKTGRLTEAQKESAAKMRIVRTVAEAVDAVNTLRKWGLAIETNG